MCNVWFWRACWRKLSTLPIVTLKSFLVQMSPRCSSYIVWSNRRSFVWQNCWGKGERRTDWEWNCWPRLKTSLSLFHNLYQIIKTTKSCKGKFILKNECYHKHNIQKVTVTRNAAHNTKCLYLDNLYGWWLCFSGARNKARLTPLVKFRQNQPWSHADEDKPSSFVPDGNISRDHLRHNLEVVYRLGKKRKTRRSVFSQWCTELHLACVAMSCCSVKINSCQSQLGVEKSLCHSLLFF